MRMASIPHGTTITAQCLAPTSGIAGPPTIPAVDITPFVIGTSNKIRFASHDASNTSTARLPQDLGKFIAAGTIAQAIREDPNTVLRNANKGKNITKTTPTAPELVGGTANMAFLEGASIGLTTGPNADAAQMSATFWVSEVQSSVVCPSRRRLEGAITPRPTYPSPGAEVPSFLATPPHDITSNKTLTVTTTQIQCSQNFSLNCLGCHAAPTAPVPILASAWN